jgi:hypothetical protein
MQCINTVDAIGPWSESPTRGRATWRFNVRREIPAPPDDSSWRCSSNRTHAIAVWGQDCMPASAPGTHALLQEWPMENDRNGWRTMQPAERDALMAQLEAMRWDSWSSVSSQTCHDPVNTQPQCSLRQYPGSLNALGVLPYHIYLEPRAKQ